MQKRQIYFFKIGGFSEINHILLNELKARFSEHEFRTVDVEKEIICQAGGFLYLRAFTEAVARYGFYILRQRMPPRNFFPRLPCVFTAIQRWSRKNVHPRRTAFTFQTQSLFNAGREGVPHFVYTDHTYFANRRYDQTKPLLPVSKRWKQMEKELYQKANFNFTFSQFAADSIIEDYGVPSAQVRCVYSGPGTGFPFSTNTSRRTGQQILFVGGEWERKGGPDLLKAFSLVRREIPEAELIVIGSDPRTFMPGLTAIKRIPVERLKSYYESADIFCLPSRRDPSANVLVEAAAYALPIVATAVGGNKERVVDKETGFLVAPGDIDSLAKCLCRLLRDAQLRTEMGELGRKRAMEIFHWSSVMDKITSTIGEKIKDVC